MPAPTSATDAGTHDEHDTRDVDPAGPGPPGRSDGSSLAGPAGPVGPRGAYRRPGPPYPHHHDRPARTHRAGTDVQPGPKTRRELPGRMGRLAPVLVSRAGLSPVMVGRDAELGQLLRLSGGSAAAGNGGAAGAAVALVGGEPGIGKTRLVSELIGALAPVSRVLTGQADPGALGSPFHLLLDLVDGEIEDDLEAAALAGQVADTGLTVQQR